MIQYKELFASYSRSRLGRFLPHFITTEVFSIHGNPAICIVVTSSGYYKGMCNLGKIELLRKLYSYADKNIISDLGIQEHPQIANLILQVTCSPGLRDSAVAPQFNSVEWTGTGLRRGNMLPVTQISGLSVASLTFSLNGILSLPL